MERKIKDFCYTKFGKVIHSRPNVSPKRSISRTHRLINFTPVADGFGVDGFRIRINSDAGRVGTENRHKYRYSYIKKIQKNLPFVACLLMTVTCDASD